jgi:hypothetical protein
MATGRRDSEVNMSEMVERAARAIHARIGQGTLWDDLDDYSRSEYLADARAGIEAIREPNDWMVVVGDERIIQHLNSSEVRSPVPTPAQNCWKAMIGEMLK